MKQWEYKIIYETARGVAFEDFMNNFGLSGWELVNVSVVPHALNGMLIFKRQKQ